MLVSQLAQPRTLSQRAGLIGLDVLACATVLGYATITSRVVPLG